MITIHLLGDSLVTAYGSDKENIIGGWGDHLGCFFDSRKIQVLDYGQAGRSTRSFLNEGRFIDNGHFTFDDFPYLGPAYNRIQAGDYVFIEFGHNDDDSREKVNLFDRMTPLGEPDENGIYPIIVPEESMKVSNKIVPPSYAELMRLSGVAEKEIPAQIERGMKLMPRYEDMYYSYDCGATYKGYLKFYIDKICEKGAHPVLVTPTCRLRMDKGRIIPFPGHHGNCDRFGTFPYIRAVKQLGEWEQIPVIDLFSFTKRIFEILGYEDASYLQSIMDLDGQLIGDVRMGRPGCWPEDFNSRREKGDIGGIDDTHQNRFGSYIFAEFIAKEGARQIEDLKEGFLTVPTRKTACPAHLLDRLYEIERELQ